MDSVSNESFPLNNSTFDEDEDEEEYLEDECPECEAVFPDMATLIQHCNTAHEFRSETVSVVASTQKCRNCTEQFSGLIALREHCEKFHANDVEINDSDANLNMHNGPFNNVNITDQCLTSIRNKDDQQKLKEEHAIIENISCHKCDLSLRGEMDLKEHKCVILLKPDGEKKTDSDNIIPHLESSSNISQVDTVDSDEDLEECPDCDEPFPSIIALNDHFLKVHENTDSDEEAVSNPTTLDETVLNDNFKTDYTSGKLNTKFEFETSDVIKAPNINKVIHNSQFNLSESNFVDNRDDYLKNNIELSDELETGLENCGSEETKEPFKTDPVESTAVLENLTKENYNNLNIQTAEIENNNVININKRLEINSGDSKIMQKDSKVYEEDIDQIEESSDYCKKVTGNIQEDNSNFAFNSIEEDRIFEKELDEIQKGKENIYSEEGTDHYNEDLGIMQVDHNEFEYDNNIEEYDKSEAVAKNYQAINMERNLLQLENVQYFDDSLDAGEFKVAATESKAIAHNTIKNKDNLEQDDDIYEVSINDINKSKLIREESIHKGGRYKIKRRGNEGISVDITSKNKNLDMKSLLMKALLDEKKTEKPEVISLEDSDDDIIIDTDDIFLNNSKQANDTNPKLQTKETQDIGAIEIIPSKNVKIHESNETKVIGVQVDSKINIKECPMEENLDEKQTFYGKCNECNEDFPNMDQCISHMKGHGKLTSKDNTEAKNARKSEGILISPPKRRKMNGGYINHSQESNTSNGQSCNLCKINFQNASLYQRHMKSKKHIQNEKNKKNQDKPVLTETTTSENVIQKASINQNKVELIKKMIKEESIPVEQSNQHYGKIETLVKSQSEKLTAHLNRFNWNSPRVVTDKDGESFMKKIGNPEEAKYSCPINSCKFVTSEAHVQSRRAGLHLTFSHNIQIDQIQDILLKFTKL